MSTYTFTTTRKTGKTSKSATYNNLGEMMDALMAKTADRSVASFTVVSSGFSGTQVTVLTRAEALAMDAVRT